jgi:hypothetical protein
MADKTISDAGGNWSDAACWVEGSKPTAGQTVAATATSGDVVINEATATLGEFNLSAKNGGGNTIAISGTGQITVRGNFLLGAGVTWTGSGSVYLVTNTFNFDSAGLNLSSITQLVIYSSCSVTLINNDLNIGTKPIYIYGAATL